MIARYIHITVLNMYENNKVSNPPEFRLEVAKQAPKPQSPDTTYITKI